MGSRSRNRIDPVSTDSLISVRILWMTYKSLLSLYDTPTPKIVKSYLLGALHDATERKYTYRISQKSEGYVKFLAKLVKPLGYKAWCYREGKDRKVFVVEFAKRILNNVKPETVEEKKAYVRGYFDAEGSVPRSKSSRYYIYLAQKNLEDLTNLRNILTDLGISCGIIHNPSFHIDPNYYRFYVSSKSHQKFVLEIGSWHLVKGKHLRMKI